VLAAGRRDEALRHFRRAATLAPRDARIAFNHAKALAALEQRSAAVSILNRALQLDSQFGEAHHQLGALLFSGNHLREAIAHLRQAVDLMPQSGSARADLGGALAEAGQHEEAAVHLRRALQLDPSNHVARQNLAILERPQPR
jgi:Flp pilus assembly protein TadD